MSNVAVIINTLDGHQGNLAEAIDSYRRQTVPTHVFVSTLEGDPSLSHPLSQYFIPVVGLRSEHPGYSPEGSFKQINDAVLEAEMRGYKYFAFADGNDVALPTKIEHERERLISSGAKVCYSSFMIDDGKRRRRYMSRPYSYETHLQESYVNDCSLIDLSTFRKYGPLRTDIGVPGFWHFFLTVAENEGEGAFVNNPLIEWVYHRSPGRSRMALPRDSDRAAREKRRADIDGMLRMHGVRR